MIGVILAAGAGTRLMQTDVVRPKCLARFGGTPLLEFQLRTLRWCGVSDIAVVVGFEADRVRRVCGFGVRIIENPEFAATNSLYSLWLARALLEGGFLVMNCDVLFHPAMLTELLSARHENALLVSYPEPDALAFTDEEMKVSVRKGRVVDIRKDLPARETDGENVGIAKFSARGASRLIAVMDRIVRSGDVGQWAPRAFREFAREDALYAVGTRGLPWTEIDTAADYQHASCCIFPAIRDAATEVVPALRWGA